MVEKLRGINTVLLFLFPAFVVYQATPVTLAQELTERVDRQTYTNENAPPEIRFKILLMEMGYVDNRSDRRIAYQLEQIGFDRRDISKVAAYLGNVRDEIDVEVSRSIWRIACSDSAANLSGSEIRAVYNALDDVRQGIHAKYLAVASAELAAMNYPDFPYMLNALTSSFRVTRTDHRYGWGTTDDDIHQNRVKLCTNIKKYSASAWE